MNERMEVEVFAMEFGNRYVWIHLHSDQHTKIVASSFTCFSTENNGEHLLNMYFLSALKFAALSLTLVKQLENLLSTCT